MLRGRLKALVVCTGVAVLVLLAMPALAQKSANDILSNKQIEKIALDQKAVKIKKELEELQSNLLISAKKIRENEEILSDTEEKINFLIKEREEHIEKIHKDEKNIGMIIRAARRYNSASGQRLLIEKDPVNLARASFVMRSMLPRLQEQAVTLKTRLTEIESLEAEIIRQSSESREEFNKYKTQKEKIENLLQQKRSLHKKTEAARKSSEVELARLARESRSLEELVSKIQPKPLLQKSVAATKTAKLPSGFKLPVSGNVHTAYGETDDMGAISKGLTIRTRANATVTAPISGKVLFAGPFQKFRQILIIEHEGGYHSLIAGLDRIDTVVGAAVVAGEPVGISETAQDSGTVYYELRRNNKPVNPFKTNIAQRQQEKT